MNSPRIGRLWAICGLGFLLAASVHARNARSTIRTVDLSGTDAKYSIEIWLPREPRGPSPSVGLFYDHHNQSNGLVGVGWNLVAASAIERCGREAGQETETSVIELSMNDGFCLDSRRLELAGESPPYGTPGSRYVLGPGSGAVVTAYGVQGNGPLYFVAEGYARIWEYGHTVDARVFPGRFPAVSATAHRWMLDKVTDVAGYGFEISYGNHDGFAVPKRISWGAKPGDDGGYPKVADFRYSESRPRNDSYDAQIAGYPVMNRQRLQSIRVVIDGVVRREYLFAYDNSDRWGRSRLIAVQECHDETSSHCLPPLVFRY